MKNGMGLVVRMVHFDKNDKRIAMETGRMDADGAILGKLVGHEMFLEKDLADTISRDHELFHWIENNLLTESERMVFRNKAKAYERDGNFMFEWRSDMRENSANAFAQFLNEREQHRGTPLGRIIQKILDFFDGLMHIGRMSERKLAREVESGKVFGREGQGRSTEKPRHTFAGPEARTADKGKAFEAQQMRDAGEPRLKVWRETGWWEIIPGSDVWSFEIDDSKVSMINDSVADLLVKPILSEGLDMGAAKLGDIIDAQDLFSSYPESADTTVILSKAGKPETASFQDGEIWLYGGIGPDNLAAMKSILLHEIQHAIQEYEGFAVGGAVEWNVSGPIHWPSDMPDMWDVMQAADKIKRLSSQFNTTPEKISKQYRDAFKLDDDLLGRAIKLSKSPDFDKQFEKAKDYGEMKPFAAYQRLTGEAQARLTQRRRDMTPAQRKKEPPWFTLKMMMWEEGLIPDLKTNPEDVLISRYEGGAAYSTSSDRLHPLSDPATDSIIKGDTGKMAGNPLLKLFESVADRFERSDDSRLKDLGKRIRDYYDRVEANSGKWRGALKPHLDGIKRKDREAFHKSFAEYWQHHDNGRAKEAQAILDSNKPLADMVKTIKDLYHKTGLDNQEKGVLVQEGRRWRPIGKIPYGQFWPRQLKADVSRVLRDKDFRYKNLELWGEMVDALIEDGHILTREEADKYLTSYFSGEASNDYFANIEKARGVKLPEMFYDYSVDVVQRYANKWSQRIAQIEFFGQETDKTHDVFHDLVNQPIDTGTKEYIKAVRDNIYNVRKADIYGQLMDYMNIFATATQLGNPGTATLNLIGGTLLNIQHMGLKNTFKAMKDLARDWKSLQQEGTELGILGKDLLNLMRDLDAPTTEMFTPESKVKDALAKFADVTMTWGGYKVTENFIRSTAMVAARYQLQDALRTWNQNPSSADALVYKRNLTKNGIDWQQLLIENGSGEETGKYLRKMVNIPQGSYKIDQTPLYVDTRAGRFFFKYQKFGTQVSKMFYDNFFHPLINAKDPKERAKHFWRTLQYFSYAAAGGTLILAARAAMFGYNDPGPDDDDIVQAFKNDDIHRAVSLLFSRAWHSMLAASAFGYFGNYIQFTMDVADQQRVKNPLDPPGLATINFPIELTTRWMEQGKLTGKDIEQVTEQSLAIYRANKRLTTKAMSEFGSEWKHAKLEEHRRERQFTRKIVRQFAKEYDIPAKRTLSGRLGHTPMSPINKQMYDALVMGNPEQVRLINANTLKSLKGDARKKAIASMKASARARQPLSINGSINDRERYEFYRWAKKNLSPGSYLRIREVDVNYRRTMVRTGLASKVGYVPPL